MCSPGELIPQLPCNPIFWIAGIRDVTGRMCDGWKRIRRRLEPLRFVGITKPDMSPDVTGVSVFCQDLLAGAGYQTCNILQRADRIVIRCGTGVVVVLVEALVILDPEWTDEALAGALDAAIRGPRALGASPEWRFLDFVVFEIASSLLPWGAGLCEPRRQDGGCGFKVSEILAPLAQ